MNETPHEPGGPADAGHGWPHDPTAPSRPTVPIPPDTDEDDEDDEDDDEAEQPSRHRFLSGGRLAVAVGVVVILAGAGLAFVLTSGGGEGAEEGDGSGSSDEATAVEDAAFRFAECMREHGLEDFPDPLVSDQGISFGGAPSPDEPENMSPEEQAATEACQPIIEEAGPLRGEEDLSPEEVAELQDQALAMSQCMRDRGWDMPDPEVGEDGSIMIHADEANGVIPEPGDPDSDRFRQDQQECHEQSGLEVPGGGAGAAGVSDGNTPHREGS